ncbi:MAG: hypothetical protein JOZ57_02880, partial [Abitibacteriaceae bacterium]|nr:hypothetical protein [Abditibacteriaceae bacterium]
MLYCVVFGVLVSNWQTGIARANTYVVTTTADENDLVGPLDGNGQTSLREAIILANGHPGPDTITFNIPSGGLKVITLTSALPSITDTVTIDGTTQPLAPPNPHPPLIAVTASAAGTYDGLVLTTGGSGSTIQGLSLYGFVNAIVLDNSNNNTITANFLGLDQGGNVPGNTNLGIYVSDSSGNTIGVPNAGNVISGNGTAGITISGSASGANNNVVQSNLIGTTP